MTPQLTERASLHASFFASFFALPIEIRNNILTDIWAPRLKLHIFFKEDRLMTAACLGAQTGDETSALGGPCLKPENHRMPSDEETTLSRRLHERYPIESYKSRLHSPWGNHYRCEEDWNPMPGHISTEKNSCISLLLVNKMMYAECMRFISQHLDVTITDMKTAAFLTDVSRTMSDKPQPMIPLHLLRSSQFFNIVLFDSLELLTALALSSEDSISSHPLKYQSHTVTGLEICIDWDLVESLLPQRQEWNQIWLGIAALPHISRVTLWVDHRACSSWSEVNERALLEPLRKARWPLNIEATVYLPNIPSDNIRPDYQFVGDIDHDAGLPFRVRRRIRCPDRCDGDLWKEGAIWFLPDVSKEEKGKFDDFGICWELNSVTTGLQVWEDIEPMMGFLRSGK
ncbi:hypothetical protein EDB81DRAFT_794779 [Dactylonectria macrodidyma]|uniref:Uncharacterized protein n=1 Tax=Dactylonectria macrodidyma TaxID=307937 RepID=A0A9P9EVZ0_9HYPO|nr:hypothetical protein EDB81DRAFT_794779 [Dactylonectria macrodidyma]